MYVGPLAFVGAGSTLIVQLIQNGGRLECVNWANVKWSALTGGASGFFLTFKIGTSIMGIATIGAGGNMFNYRMTSSNRSYRGYGLAGLSGVAGGIIGGKTPNPRWFSQPSPWSYNHEMTQQLVAIKTLGMNLFGSLASSFDYENQSSDAPCGC